MILKFSWKMHFRSLSIRKIAHRSSCVYFGRCSEDITCLAFQVDSDSHMCETIARGTNNTQSFISDFDKPVYKYGENITFLTCTFREFYQISTGPLITLLIVQVLVRR